MNFLEIIRKKRDKEELSKEEINFLISSFTEGKIPDYQFSSFLMAAYLNGMNDNETFYLTEAMLFSGVTVDLNKINGFKVDKHSTGGVGDKTSLIIAPIAAAAGLFVPMISGRGLGHTGGTLDKLESIPGFKTNLTLNEYKKILSQCGAVLIGQTENIAPADKLIYALRDVTATVESIPLITSSIMSKKLAEGIDGLVLDIKTGSGAFMRDYESAQKLAGSLLNTAESFGKKVIAFITDMNQPLGNYLGNWFEVQESVKVLKGELFHTDLTKLCLYLSGAMLFLGNKASSIEEGFDISEQIIKSGDAYKKFIEIVKHQNGDINYIEHPESYPLSKISLEVKINAEGYIAEINTYEVGMAAVELGAGRKLKEDKIDPKAGIKFNVKLGDKVNKGDIAAVLFSDSEDGIKEAELRILNSIQIKNVKQKIPELIKTIIFKEEQWQRITQ